MHTNLNRLGWHKNCGGAVSLTRHSGEPHYRYEMCSKCHTHVPIADIVSERPVFPRQKTAGRKPPKRSRYDIKSWKDVKA